MAKIPISTPQNHMINLVSRAIQGAAEDCAIKAREQFDKDMNERISKIVLEFAREVNVASRGDEVVITLRDQLGR